MRQGQNNKRSRGRPNNRKSQSGRSYDSNGPDVKIRGTAAHIYEKYQSLARDAQASGDRIIAENYLQHAEHYFRVMLASEGPGGVQNRMNQPQQPGRPQMQPNGGGQQGDDESFDEDGNAQANGSNQAHVGNQGHAANNMNAGANGHSRSTDDRHEHGNGRSNQPTVQAREAGASNGQSHAASGTGTSEPVMAEAKEAGEPELDLGQAGNAAPEEQAAQSSGEEAKGSSGNGQPPRRRGRPPRARAEAAPAPASETEAQPESSEPASS